MTEIRTHYDNLQVKETASAEVIKGAYKFLSQKWHPDKNLANQEQAEKYLKIINQAYFVLSDPDRRQKHDEWIRNARNSKSQLSNHSAAHPHPQRPQQKQPESPPQPTPSNYGAKAETKPTYWRLDDLHKLPHASKGLLFAASCLAMAGAVFAGFHYYAVATGRDYGEALKALPGVALFLIPWLSLTLLYELHNGLFHPQGWEGTKSDRDNQRRVDQSHREFKRRVTATTRRQEIKVQVVAFFASVGLGWISALLLSASVDVQHNGIALWDKIGLWLICSLSIWALSGMIIYGYFSKVKQKQTEAATRNQYYRWGS